jgi:Entner-Doudoroff aldolase
MTGEAARLDALLDEMPIVAILRGIRADEAVAVVEALFDAGIRIAEVPLNSPDPFATIALLAGQFGARMMIGAGTVTDPTEVRRLADCGGRLCVSPHTDPVVIAEALRLGLVPMPGCATATEAFTAFAAGARHLKYFPAGGHADDIAALRTVLPPAVRLLAVGGVSLANLPALRKAGVEAFGIGSDLYKPGRSAGEVGARATAFVAALAVRSPAVRLICNPQAAIGESPIRIGGRDTLWVDPLAPRLLRFRTELDEVRLDRPVWSLAMTPSGAIAGTLDAGFCTIDAATGGIVAGPEAELDAGCRFNDMAMDPAGGLWAGAMHRGVLAGRGAIFHARAPDAPPVCVARGLGVPNGMAFSPDGATLYLIDTLARTLLACPVDPDQGSLGEPVIVTDFMNVPGKPDGMTIGPDGTLWVAMWGGGCVVEIGRDGAVLRVIDLPAPHVSSLCFAAGETLHVTTSRMRLSPRQLADHPGSGGLFAIDRGAAG